MAHIVLFHHACGLTPGVAALAETWRADGHVVETPDLYDGLTFATVDEGVAHADAVGFAVLRARAAAALPAAGPLVLAGISMGVLDAEIHALSRPRVRGVILLEATVPPAAFAELGIPTVWPAAVPVQIHGMEGDPFFAGEGDLEAARELLAGPAEGELHLYPGSDHLFCDSSLASFDPAATARMLERTRAFLAGLDGGPATG